MHFRNCLLFLAILPVLFGCRPSAPSATDKPPISTQEGIASWYEVPEGSRPQRLAEGQMTAASDKIPAGSTVQVINLSNQKSAIVHITDNGLHGESDIDLCKPAAQQLGMITKGVTKVRIEVLEGPAAGK